MNKIASDLRQLDLSDVQMRVHEKYDITLSDAMLAIQYLRCFFDAKRTNPNRLIILPQISDWAWHELILDTTAYRTLCFLVFGRPLPHVAQDIRLDERPHTEFNLTSAELPHGYLRDEFRKSMGLMHRAYGLGLGERPNEWLEAGWDRPRYRLRTPIKVSPSRCELANWPAETEGCDLLPDEIISLGLWSWLPARVARRFGLTRLLARRSVEEYAQLLLSLRSSGATQPQCRISELCRVAWQEHVLWTERYAEDCDRILGRFLSHSPRASNVFGYDLIESAVA